MEKSIEAIWTKGFLKEEHVAAPKLNNLYNRKSLLLIEKFKRTYRTDNRSLIPIALVSAVGFGIAGHLILGVYIMTLMFLLYFLNKKRLTSLEKINIDTTSYKYLVQYREMFFGLKAYYIKLLGVGLPLTGIFGYYLFFRNTALFESFMEIKLVYLIGIIMAVAGFLSALGIIAYLLSVKILYGNLLKKLDEMIMDMEELQK